MERLPQELNTKIFKGFTVKRLCQLRCVSKSFNTLLRSHYFTKIHRDQTSSTNGIKLLVVGNSSLHTLNISDKDDDKVPCHPLPLRIPLNPINGPTQLVGSCKGLACLFQPPNTYAFLNPTTREFRVLPDPGTFPTYASVRFSGFGFVQSLDDFMVVSAATHKYGLFPSVIRVYSDKANSWKTMPAEVKVPFSAFTPAKSAYANGVAHWLGYISWVDRHGNARSCCKIMGFDFANDKFEILLLHENIDQGEIKAFGALGGCICVLARDADLSLGMWVMKEYGVVDSWTKTFSIRRASTQKPSTSIFPICDAGDEVLFEINKQLVLYDTVKNTAAKLKAGLQGIREWEGKLDMARYEECLVSPHAYFCQVETQAANDVAEEDEGSEQESAHGASQGPHLSEILHQIYSPFVKDFRCDLTRPGV